MSLEPRAATTLAALIVAGGRARRLGGADKPALHVDGRSLLASAIEAARAVGCADVVVVGPERPDAHDVVTVREKPPFGGPVAAVVTALPSIHADRVLLMPADVPRARDAAELLLSTEPGVDGVCLVDAGGRRQLLFGVYDVRALRTRAERTESAGQGVSLRDFLDGLRIAEIADPHGLSADVDTWEDVRAARTAATKRRGRES